MAVHSDGGWVSRCVEDFTSGTGTLLQRNVLATFESESGRLLESGGSFEGPIVTALVADVSALPGRAIRSPACVFEPAEFV